MDLQTFLVIFVRLGIAAFLLLIAMACVRVMLEVRMDQRRTKRLLAAKDTGLLTRTEFEADVGVLFDKAG